jgi:hypothetical protein
MAGLIENQPCRTGVRAHAVAKQDRQDLDHDLVDETSLQALTCQVGTEDLQILNNHLHC